jgi:hypothetical protein
MYFFLLFSLVSSNRFLVDTLDHIKFVRDIRGMGLKQELHTSIDLTHPMNCILFDSISKEWFIDVEEIPKDIQVEFQSNIDIELPSSLSTAHNYTIRFNKTTSFVIPIHLRYNECSYTEKYKEIILPNPTLKCEGNFFRIKGDEISAFVPVGDLRDRDLVIMATILMVAFSVGWISWSVLKGFRANKIF